MHIGATQMFYGMVWYGMVWWVHLGAAPKYFRVWYKIVWYILRPGRPNGMVWYKIVWGRTLRAPKYFIVWAGAHILYGKVRNSLVHFGAGAHIVGTDCHHLPLGFLPPRTSRTPSILLTSGH